ncbi:MarR family transcriptional regulator [Paenibacillus sp. FJAT-26967]|uniref:MarR family transcriptional regulator n=1 Tax=Paenibacillus sp. FJAT-26967 TaxID=1729690 RepID=UPI0008395C33|nr:MarR family transcriptional regulator [Paenibacillus sp. FJAT-26967]
MLSSIFGKLYYDLTLHELKMMNSIDLYPNLTYNSLLYLDLIACNPNCTVSSLAELLHVSKSAVTIKVSELIKQGFVEKNQSELDKRVYYLSVKPEIQGHYEIYNQIIKQAGEKMKDTYTTEEISLFCNMLSSFNKFCFPEKS